MVDLLLCGKIMFAFPKILVCAHQITKGGPFNGVSRKTKLALQTSVLVCIQLSQVWKIQNYVDIYHYILLILLLVLLPAQLTLFYIYCALVKWKREMCLLPRRGELSLPSGGKTNWPISFQRPSFQKRKPRSSTSLAKLLSCYRLGILRS
jgi:hypothetical protein